MKGTPISPELRAFFGDLPIPDTQEELRAELVELIGIREREEDERRRTLRCFVYLIGASSTGRYKIGYTTNIKSRLRGLRVSCPVDLELVCHKECFYPEAVDLEKKLHDYLRAHNTHGEWFALTDDALKYVREVLGEASPAV